MGRNGGMLPREQVLHALQFDCVSNLITMDLCNTGTKNSSVNTGRTVNWQKTKRIKARVAKKRANVKERHRHRAIEGVSGAARSKKSQRKIEHRQRMSTKEAEALDAAMDVDVSTAVKPKSTKKESNAVSPSAMQE
jgi:hypothetical protein